MKIMKFIKKHKIEIIALFTIIIICILGYFAVKPLLGNDSNKYGNRLDGIENVKITDEQVKKLTSEMEENKDVKSIKYDLQGRLIYIILEVSNETAVDVSKGYANKILNYFDDEQKTYYDMQVIIKSDSKESEVYPIIGAKHKTSTSFIWDNKSTKKEK